MLPLLAAQLLYCGADALKVFSTAQLQGLAVLLANLYKSGFIIAQLFYGTWLLPLGYLVYKSDFLPRLSSTTPARAHACIFSCGWHITRDGNDVYPQSLIREEKLARWLGRLTHIVDIDDQVEACRLDICRAANRHFEQTIDHDGRIAALVMLDAGRLLSQKLNGRAIVFDLSGVAGGAWKVGGGEVASQVRMDVLDFNIFASGRFTYEEALARATISGDVSLAEAALKNLLILY